MFESDALIFVSIKLQIARVEGKSKVRGWNGFLIFNHWQDLLKRMCSVVPQSDSPERGESTRHERKIKWGSDRPEEDLRHP